MWRAMVLAAVLAATVPGTVFAQADAGSPATATMARWGLAARDFSALGAVALLQKARIDTRFAEAEAAAGQGDVAAMTLVGLAYSNGVGTARDDDKSLRWLNTAADLGDARAISTLAYALNNRGAANTDKPDAMAMFTRAAKLGNGVAEYNLGGFYEHGTVVPRDMATAGAWYEKAANQGFVSAQITVGLGYETGAWAPQSTEKAIYWLTLAEQQDSPVAATELGRLYAMAGPFYDPDRSASSYRRGANLGSADARKALAALVPVYSGPAPVDIEDVLRATAPIANAASAPAAIIIQRGQSLLPPDLYRMSQGIDESTIASNLENGYCIANLGAVLKGWEVPAGGNRGINLSCVRSPDEPGLGMEAMCWVKGGECAEALVFDEHTHPSTGFYGPSWPDFVVPFPEPHPEKGFMVSAAMDGRASLTLDTVEARQLRVSQGAPNAITQSMGAFAANTLYELWTGLAPADAREPPGPADNAVIAGEAAYYWIMCHEKKLACYVRDAPDKPFVRIAETWRPTQAMAAAPLRSLTIINAAADQWVRSGEVGSSAFSAAPAGDFDPLRFHGSAWPENVEGFTNTTQTGVAGLTDADGKRFYAMYGFRLHNPGDPNGQTFRTFEWLWKLGQTDYRYCLRTGVNVVMTDPDHGLSRDPNVTSTITSGDFKLDCWGAAPTSPVRAFTQTLTADGAMITRNAEGQTAAQATEGTHSFCTADKTCEAYFMLP